MVVQYNFSSNEYKYKRWRNGEEIERIIPLTAMYGLQPAVRVFASESTSWPLIPKSQSLISPLSLTSMFDGLTSKYQNII